LETDPYSTTAGILANVDIKPFTWNVGLELLILVFLLFCTALVSGSETAFFSLSPEEKFKLQNKKLRKYKLAALHLKNPDHLLSIVLILNNFISVGAVILSTYITNQLFDFSHSPLIGFLFDVVVITFLLLLFGEIMPKIYANSHALSFTLFMAIPLHYASKFLKPLSSLLISSTRLIHKKLASKKHNISVSDLSTALELTQGTIAEDKNILHGIVRFGNIAVHEIMKPRIDVVAVEYDEPFPSLISTIIESGYSRIPVYEETFDSIRGILYIKDLLPFLNKDSNFAWQSLIRTPYYVPESKKIDDLLQDFQANKVHMAIVVDEYGGTSGILTLEDILEEIVGDITDESDDEEVNYKKLSENSFLFEGKIQINDFHKITGTDERELSEIRGEAETLAGLILEIKGEIPEKRDEIHYGRFTFVVESSDKRRIKQIKVTINKTPHVDLQITE
jgi:putative hemolysin